VPTWQCVDWQLNPDFTGRNARIAAQRNETVMIDPLGIVSRVSTQSPGVARPQPAGAADFKQELLDELRKVNEMQQDASKATNDLMTGQRDDIEGVMIATQKADSAFRMLVALQNKVVGAYDEVRNIRV
jgi:flagellar hook-basal body complex protein FliE